MLKNKFLLRDEDLLEELHQNQLKVDEPVKELYREIDKSRLYNTIVAIFKIGEETTPPLL